MTALPFTIEPQHAADAEAIERLSARAFGPGRFARTAFRVREQAGEHAGLGFVARIGSLMIGSVTLTPVRVGETKAFMLGPLIVEKAFEGRGIGRALLERAATAARAIGAPAILLVGDEPYYARHGYKRVVAGQISLPGPVDPGRLLMLELRPGGAADLCGELRGIPA